MEMSDEAPDGLAAMRAEIDKIQAETAGAAPAATDFGQSLSDAGIDATVTPKSAAGEPEEAPQEAPDTSGLDALTEAMGKGRMTREERIASREALLKRAEAAELPGSVAKALANHASPKEAEAYLSRVEGLLQSNVAGQPASPEPVAPVQGAAPLAGMAEVQSALSDTLGEGPAQVVIDMIRQANDRAERAELVATQVTQQTAHESGARSVMEVAREMSGELPGLLRGEQIDPTIGQVAADLYAGSGPYAGDLRAALRMAHQTVSSQQAAPRQTTNATPTTALPQSDAPVSGVRRIPKEEFAQRTAALAGKFANQPEEFERQMALLEAEVRRANEIAAQHGL